jgi:hypothetical protein
MSSGAGRPETEVSEKARRRRFTAEFKARLLREAAASKESGTIGALLRREALVLVAPDGLATASGARTTRWADAEKARSAAQGRR